MVTRRRVVAGSISGLLLSNLAGSWAFGAAEAAEEPLIALPGKRPLIKRTFRPPNYETPLTELRSQITANDAFFVRYHLASIPAIDSRADCGSRRVMLPPCPSVSAVSWSPIAARSQSA